MTTSLRLFAGSCHIGFLEPDKFDWPKIFATFEPVEGFQALRELFDKQNAPGGFQTVRKEMDGLDLRIVDPDGTEDPLFTIIIKGERAMWREGFRRVVKTARNDQFWSILGAEGGPETCREPGCTRLRIGQSVFCKRHHFRMIMGEDYMGTLDDG